MPKKEILLIKRNILLSSYFISLNGDHFNFTSLMQTKRRPLVIALEFLDLDLFRFIINNLDNVFELDKKTKIM